ncbi:MAG: hypothetical protein ACKVQK_25185, partial [Burkholderiales bacterium]
TPSNRRIDFGAAVGAVTLPTANSSVIEANSVVRATDNNIVAIGGLMKVDPSDAAGMANNARSISDAPRNNSESGTKKELVVLLKPTVIRDARVDAEKSSAAPLRNVVLPGR